MLDLETLGTKPGSVILSIGATKFDHTGPIGEQFHVGINIDSCLEAGLTVNGETLTVNGETLMWWLDPERNAAREEWLRLVKFYLSSALGQLTRWMMEEGGDVELWGNGANFDNNLLSTAYDVLNTPKPWKFWNDRCYRTMKAMYPHIKMPKREGTHHNALDDAISQVNHLILFPAFQEMCSAEMQADHDAKHPTLCL